MGILRWQSVWPMITATIGDDAVMSCHWFYLFGPFTIILHGAVYQNYWWLDPVSTLANDVPSTVMFRVFDCGERLAVSNSAVAVANTAYRPLTILTRSRSRLVTGWTGCEHQPLRCA